MNCFLDTNSKVKKLNSGEISFTRATEKMDYLGINWRNVQCLLEENDKTLLRGIKEKLKKEKGTFLIEIQYCEEFRAF